MNGSSGSRGLSNPGALTAGDASSAPVAAAIRRARLADAASIAQLCAQLGYPATRSQVRQRLAPILAEVPHAIFVAEGPEGTLLGWVEVYSRRLLVEELHAELGGLVVAEDSRGQGLGRRLMGRAEAWARDQGCQFLLVRSNVIREGAHGFYRQIGYQEIKRQATFRKQTSGVPPFGRETPEVSRPTAVAASHAG